MIQANELRIGNWVKLIGGDKIFTIQFPLHNDLCEGFHQMLLLVEPIPLTPEILDKLKDTPIFMDKYGFAIFKNSYSYLFTWEEYPFLHQLQNLYFALTGQELTINL